jgi:hypothetical protein
MALCDVTGSFHLIPFMKGGGMKKELFIWLAVILFMHGMTSTVSASTVWNSNFITFTKANYADWTLAANQDRIVSDVWLTRGDNAGLFNAAVESWISGNSGWSGEPTGTKWAIGTTANYDTLTYTDWLHFVNANAGTNLVGTSGVVHLLSADIYIDIQFTQWTKGDGLGGSGGGGFSYTRASSPSPVPIPAAVWLLGSGLIGLLGIRKRSRK